jgi:hypothetical protein
MKAVEIIRAISDLGADASNNKDRVHLRAALGRVDGKPTVHGVDTRVRLGVHNGRVGEEMDVNHQNRAIFELHLYISCEVEKKKERGETGIEQEHDECKNRSRARSRLQGAAGPLEKNEGSGSLTYPKRFELCSNLRRVKVLSALLDVSVMRRVLMQSVKVGKHELYQEEIR